MFCIDIDPDRLEHPPHWRDALRSLRGFNVCFYRVYSFAGGRGISPPGDFKPRRTLLTDGIESNEHVYDSALIGGEFLSTRIWSNASRSFAARARWPQAAKHRAAWSMSSRIARRRWKD